MTSNLAVTGGMESMSQGCYYVPKGRFGYRMGHGKLIDGMIHDALWCAINDWHMGEGTDRVADEFGTTREDQDFWAARSQQRAAAAQGRGQAGRGDSPRRDQGEEGEGAVRHR